MIPRGHGFHAAMGEVVHVASGVACGWVKPSRLGESGGWLRFGHQIGRWGTLSSAICSYRRKVSGGF